MARKGSELPLNISFEVIMLMVGFLVIIGLIIAIFGGLGGFMACDDPGGPPKWKFWCFNNGTNLDDQLAMQSVNAFVCATKAVAEGNAKHPCLNDFPAPATPVVASLTGMQTAKKEPSKYDNAYVTCQELSSQSKRETVFTQIAEFKSDVKDCTQEKVCGSDKNCKVSVEKNDNIGMNSIYPEGKEISCKYRIYKNSKNEIDSDKEVRGGLDIEQNFGLFKSQNPTVKDSDTELLSCQPADFENAKIKEIKLNNAVRCPCKINFVDGYNYEIKKDDKGEYTEYPTKQYLEYHVYGPYSAFASEVCKNDAKSIKDLSLPGLRSNIIDNINAVLKDPFIITESHIEESSDIGECSSTNGEFSYVEGNRAIMNSYSCIKETKKTDVSCTINNFKLPQKVSDPAAWIKGNGDPRYLVYWRNFPNGISGSWADARSTKGNLVEIGTDVLGTIVSSHLPIVGRFSASTRFTFATIATSNIARPLYESTAYKEEIKNVDEQIKDLVESMEDKDRETIYKDIAGSLNEQGSNDATEKKTVITNYVKSILTKYLPFKDSVVFKKPYEDPQSFKVELGNKPMMIHEKHDAVIRNFNDQFFLASPCRANLKVEKGTINCDYGYSYDFKTDFLNCRGPEKYDGEASVKCMDELSKDGLKNVLLTGKESTPYEKLSSDNKQIVDRIYYLLDSKQSKDRLKLFENVGNNEFILYDSFMNVKYSFGYIDGNPPVKFYDGSESPQFELKSISLLKNGKEYEIKDQRFYGIGEFKTATTSSPTRTNVCFTQDDILEVCFDYGSYQCYKNDNHQVPFGFDEVGYCEIDYDDWTVLKDCNTLSGEQKEKCEVFKEFESYIEGSSPTYEKVTFYRDQTSKKWSMESFTRFEEHWIKLADNFPDTSSISYADSIMIDEETNVLEDVFGVGDIDTILFNDLNDDGDFEKHTLNKDCQIDSSTIVTLDEKLGDSPNFCLPYSNGWSSVRKISENAVEIGGIIGSGIGLIVGGTSGALPGAVVGVVKGGWVGIRIGTYVHVGYLAATEVLGLPTGPDIWPGS